MEAADQALGRAMLAVTVEAVGAEVGKDDGALQHAEDGDQDFVRDPSATPQVSTARLNSPKVIG